jgi:hypothetical protein
MAEEIHHPHDLMVRAVLSDLTEAASFLQAHLPDEVSQGLNWSTLRLVEGSFVDDDLRSSEADLLYGVEDLFAESVRDWAGVPRFAHGLIDQSGMRPEEVQGELKVRLMQLVMLAAYHPTLSWMEQAARLLGSLSSLATSGGIDYVRLFVLYILATQEPEAALSFREVLQRHAPEVEDDLMTTYAQELLAEGRAEGEIRTQVQVIEGLLREGVEWPVIERATGVNEVQFHTVARNRQDLGRALSTVTSELLKEKGYICFVDVFMKLGHLSKSDYENWRLKRVSPLERVLKLNLSCINFIMKTVRRNSLNGHLKPHMTVAAVPLALPETCCKLAGLQRLLGRHFR